MYFTKDRKKVLKLKKTQSALVPGIKLLYLLYISEEKEDQYTVIEDYKAQLSGEISLSCGEVVTALEKHEQGIESFLLQEVMSFWSWSVRRFLRF